MGIRIFFRYLYSCLGVQALLFHQHARKSRKIEHAFGMFACIVCDKKCFRAHCCRDNSVENGIALISSVAGYVMEIVWKYAAVDRHSGILNICVTPWRLLACIPHSWQCNNDIVRPPSIHRNEVNDKNTNGGPRRSLQRSATLPANPRNNPIIRHHQRYHHDEQSAEIPLIQQQPQTRITTPQRIKIRVRSTSTEKAGESINNQNVSKGSQPILANIQLTVFAFCISIWFTQIGRTTIITQAKWLPRICYNRDMWSKSAGRWLARLVAVALARSTRDKTW